MKATFDMFVWDIIGQLQQDEAKSQDGPQGDQQYAKQGI
jgi:hypothetical protein